MKSGRNVQVTTLQLIESDFGFDASFMIAAMASFPAKKNCCRLVTEHEMSGLLGAYAAAYASS